MHDLAPPRRALALALFASLAAAAAAQQPASGGGAPPTDEQRPAEAAQDRPSIEIPGLQKLTIGGQYRLRYENQQQYDFDSSSGASNDFFGQRVRLDVGLEFNDRISGRIQLQDVRNWGEETSTIDDSADGLDLHQGYVQVAEMPVIGGTTRLGRQELSLGAQRLIGALNWANQARSFDGVLHTYALEDDAVLRGFFYDVRETINAINDDVYLTGLYGTFHPAAECTLDGYAIWLHDDGQAAGTVQNRVTLGARYLQRIGDGLEVEGELATQVGERNGRDIPFAETFAGHLHGKYTLDGDLAPWIRLEVNVASGDDPDSADDERFDNLFPTAHAHWGMMDFAFWSNLLHGMAQVGCEPCARTRASVAWSVFRSLEETDRFGGPAATLSTGAPAGSSNEMGQELDLFVHHDFDTERVDVSLQAGYGVFLPGDGVRDARGTDDVAHFLYVMTDFRF